ncbi:MAG: carboxypeptidase-like regulatory domain-containing protein [Bryobacteraceae bacterium]
MKKIVVPALLLGLLSSVSGQEFRATISGHVYDASGSAVPNAKVEARHLANSEVTTATSDSSGSYTLPFLRPGQYRLSTTASGFKTSNRET